MKINVIEKVPKNKIGKLNKNGVKSESCEEDTLNYLILFGFNVELIKPSNIKKMHNPDALIMGSIWEIKTPTSYNENTIKIRFRKASKQAKKIIFDLRSVKKNANKVEKQIVGMFQNSGNVHHIMIIEKSGRLLELKR